MGSNGRLPIFLVALGLGFLMIASGIGMRIQQGRNVEVAIAATQTAIITDTPAATATATATLPPSETPTITLTPTITPTGTLPPTSTATSTPTPGPTPVPPQNVPPIVGTYPTPVESPATAIPTPSSPIFVPDGVINILLLGSDRRPDDGGFRTDTNIIVSINRNEGTVNMLSVPRDLYVYIPGWTMNRINTADGRGAAVGWPGGGPGLLRETLLYNFGITIHYYVRVDFDGFREIVDTLGGIEVAVDCTLQGYRPLLTRENFDSYEAWVDYTSDEENFYVHTLPVGVHELDGDLALWYARVRTGTTDFDRARRQQQVLRAILSRGRQLGMSDVLQIPELWRQYNDLVETDMGLGNMLQLAPIAADLDASEIRSFILTPEVLTPWLDPSQGANVYLPVPGAIEGRLTVAMQPPVQNYVTTNTATVEVRNGTNVDRLDEVASDRLAWDSLNTIATGPNDETLGETVIYDFTGRQKASQLLLMQRLLRVADANVIEQPDPNRAVDYLVVLGNNYQSCTYNPQDPVAPINVDDEDDADAENENTGVDEGDDDN
ncbi:MAG: LCP family protein [Chloroflexi bacterium]|nr:LCP family protein [Chloroflexota bacterium]